MTQPPDPLTIDNFDDFLKIGLLSRICTLADQSKPGYAEFAALRDSTQLLPEVIIGVIVELQATGDIECVEPGRSNPFRHLAPTPKARRLLSHFGPDIHELINLVPERLKVSARERSTYKEKRMDSSVH